MYIQNIFKTSYDDRAKDLGSNINAMIVCEPVQDMSIEQVRYFLFHVDFPYKTMLSNNRDFYKMTKTRII